MEEFDYGNRYTVVIKHISYFHHVLMKMPIIVPLLILSFQVDSVERVAWSPHQIVLSNHKGQVSILDCASLFGDE